MTTPEEAHLVARIAADKDADEPRLAYAEYLRRRGDSRGEYIRLEVEAARLPEGDPRREALEERSGELFGDHEEEWAQPFRDLGLSMAPFGMTVLFLERGMIETVWIDAPGVLPEQADRLFTLAPALREVAFQSESELDAAGLAALARCPLLARLEKLDLSSLDLSGAALGAFLASPYLGNLRDLDLGSNPLGVEGAKHFARCQSLVKLERLRLSGCALLTVAVRELAATRLPALLHLDLSYNEFGPEGLPALLHGGLLSGLTSLHLGNCDLGTEGFEVLADAPTFADVSELVLSSNDTGPDGAVVLARCPYLTEVRTLNLSANYIEDDGLEALAGVSVPRLVKLDLSLQRASRRGMEGFVRWPALATIEELNLGSNEFDDEAVAALAASPLLTQLRVLDLSRNRLGAVSAYALASSPVLVALADLDLTENQLGLVGAERLAAGSWPALTKLRVSALSVEEAGETLLQERFGEVISMD